MAPTSSIVAIARRSRRSGSETRRFGAFRPERFAHRRRRPRRRDRADRAAGFRPACVIGNAGTVNTGAIDDLPGARRSRGAGGSLVPCRRLHRRADRHRARKRLSRSRHGAAPIPSRSIRTNGCMRRSKSDAPWSGTLPRIAASFAVTPEYLETDPARPRSGEWLYDYGLQTPPRISGAQSLDGAEGAWRRKIRTTDRSEYRAGPLSRRD